jgi:dTDP-glucose 4,6-dehydratase
MRTIVTGGAGFIGSHLCDLLLSKGHEVVCVDNLITGSGKNIEHIKSNNFTYIKHNVIEPFHLDGEVDYVFHLASPATFKACVGIPIQIMKVNSEGTFNMLEFTKEKNARFLLASTSEVYGDPLVNPQPESYWGNVSCTGPRSVYDEAKRFAESITMAYNRYGGVETRIVRIFNTFGPRMQVNDGRVVPNFVNQALSGDDITIYGDGSYTRSFCYVSDEAEGLYRLMMSDCIEPVNIGNENEMTMQELAEVVLDITGSNSKIVYKDKLTDDPKLRRPDITKARKVLGWEPKVDLREGLTKTVEYFKSVRGE